MLKVHTTPYKLIMQKDYQLFVLIINEFLLLVWRSILLTSRLSGFSRESFHHLGVNGRIWLELGVWVLGIFY